MPLEYMLDSIEDLDESMKGLYVEKGGKFVLDVQGGDEESLRKKVTELLDETKPVKRKASELEQKLAEIEQQRKADEENARKLAEEAAKKSGDVEALEKSWQEKFERMQQELTGKYQPELEMKDKLLQDATVNATANSLANEIGIPGSAKALLPHIKSRLKMDIKDGKAVTVVTGPDGKPSAYTLDDLKQEFINDAAFAPLIVGSKATGGGANGGSGGAAGEKEISREQFNSLSPAEKSQHLSGGGTVTD